MQRFLLFLTLCFLSSLVFAQENNFAEILITDRPSLSEAPFLVKKGELQLESGFNYQLDKDSICVNKSITYNTSLLRVGVSKNFELRIIAEYLRNRTTVRETDESSIVEGANALAVGSKILLKEGKGLVPSVTLQCYLTLPYLGNKAFRPEHIAPSLRIAAMNNLTEKLSLTINAGGEWDGTHPDASGCYTLNLGYSIHQKVGYFAELYGFTREKRRSSHGVDSGFNFILHPNFQIDLSGGAGITENAPDVFFEFGLSYRVKSHKTLK
jgi:hypothetical protein